MPAGDAQPPREIRLSVGEPEAGARLDRFVVSRLPDHSRSSVQRWIRDGCVTLGGRTAKAGWPVAAGDVVTVTPPAVAPTETEPQDLPLCVLYEDANLAVIDKPAGVVVHPAAGHPRGTLVNALLHHLGHLSGVGGRARPGIVHRLDKGTSGLMVVAKDDDAHRSLTRQFQDRTVAKTYFALVWGRPPAGLVLDAPIGRDPRHRKKMSTRASRGRSAVTTIVGVEPIGALSFVSVRIGTGRTHQVRVHLSEAGFPIAGDAVYGHPRQAVGPAAAVGRLKRPFLHAGQLGFAHPADGRPMWFTSPLPADLAAILDDLRRGADAAGHHRKGSK